MPPLTSLADGRVFARRHGPDPVRVVALHGWGRSSADFDRVLTDLPALAVDLPGFGASPPPAEPMGAAGYARLLVPWLEAREAPPVIVGHSFGGRVAVTLAAERPELVDGLVLSGVPLVRREPARRPSAGYRLLRAAHRRGVVPDAWMERVRRRRGSADYRAASGVMREVLVTAVNESYEEELERLRAPVQMLWGADDTEVPVAVARRAEELLRQRGVDVRLEVLPGVGHHVPLQAPESLRKAIEAMLA